MARTPERFFSSDASFFIYGGLKHVNLQRADRRLGHPIIGLQNADGHVMFLYRARHNGKCVVCKNPAKHVLEEVAHDGLTDYSLHGNRSHKSIAHVCPNHIPDKFNFKED